MKRISFILLLCAIVSVASAQKITHTFQDVPLSEALKYIQEQATDYNITFIYDELEDFRVTTHIQNKSRRLPRNDSYTKQVSPRCHLADCWLLSCPCCKEWKT